MRKHTITYWVEVGPKLGRWNEETGKRVELKPAARVRATVEIDTERIAKVLGSKAYRNKDGTSRALDGLVKVSVGAPSPR